MCFCCLAGANKAREEGAVPQQLPSREPRFGKAAVSWRARAAAPEPKLGSGTQRRVGKPELLEFT